MHFDLKRKAILFETINTVNGRKYIGVRTLQNTPNDDWYIGSGKILKQAIKKYGRKAFIRKTLVIGTSEYCYELEAKLVTPEWVASKDNYNVSVGGWGGNRGMDAIEKGRIKQQQDYANLPEEEKQRRKEHLKRILENTKTVSGTEHAKWKGFWRTPLGDFITTRDAAKAHGIDNKAIRSRCLINNNLPIKNFWCIRDFNASDCIGKTWKALGWDFIPKEVKDA